MARKLTALGTATFLARAYRQAYETMMRGDDAGYWPDRAKNHLAKHFYGFERLPTAYTLAHIKLRQLLSELNAALPDDVRLPVYLADTMMNKAPDQINLPGADVLSREIREAIAVRDQEKILVVLGNPPYFGESDNPSRDAQGKLTFIGEKIQIYFELDGQPLNETQVKWLHNDYVKFIRFAQHEIERSGQGTVAFITDNSYLGNPTFRGMRRSLMRTFDEIYILNLHGNSNKKERAPDGSEDKNVFDIMQGVAIAVFIKKGGNQDAIIHHADLYGTRNHKYEMLRASSLQSVEWQTLLPNAPFYLFLPQEQELREEYEHAWKITDVFPANSVGIVSARDALTMQFSPEEIWNTVSEFVGLPEETAREKYRLGKDARDWQVALAQKDIKTSTLTKSKIVPVLYRPFDLRYTYYTGKSRGFIGQPQQRIMNNMIAGRNISIGITRAVETNRFEHVFVCNTLFTHHSVSIKEVNYLLPLYIYPTLEGLKLEERTANLNPAFVQAVTERIGDTPAPEAVFHYAYAVFHAPTYRTRYAPFLKIDFPRLPLPPDADTFNALAVLGKQLVALHLLEAPELTPTRIAYPVAGDHHVEKRNVAKRYLPPTPEGKPGRVYLNETEYFENVPPEAWEFRVGGYQPAFKWLDDRAGRVLTEADITHYRRMLAAMRETSALLPAVDEAFIRVLNTNDPLV